MSVEIPQWAHAGMPFGGLRWYRGGYDGVYGIWEGGIPDRSNQRLAERIKPRAVFAGISKYM